jgi:penicillin-binding protein 1A
VSFPDGKVDDLSRPIRHKAFDSAAMYEVAKILEMNIKSGTGRRAATGCPAGGKTGTTDQNHDAWFVGFTPKLATSVWVGFPKGQIPMPNLFHGGPVDGGTFPAEIWGNYMKAARRGYCKGFPKPAHPFKPKAFKRSYDRGRPAPVQPVAPLPPAPVDPGTGTTKPGIVKPPRATTPPPTPRPAPQPAPSTGGNGYDPGAYQTPPAQPAPEPPPEAVDTPPN